MTRNLYYKFRTGITDQLQHGAGNMTRKHLLQEIPHLRRSMTAQVTNINILPGQVVWKMKY